MSFRARSRFLGVGVALVLGLASSVSGLGQAAPVAPMDVAVATVTVANSPHSIAVDDSGIYGYTVTHGTHQIFKIRLSDFTVDDSMTLPDSGGWAVALYGGNVYATTDNYLFRANATTLPDTPDDSVGIYNYGMGLAISWPNAYITHHAYSNFVSKVNLTTMTVVSSIPSGGSYPVGVTVDDTYVYVVNTISNSLSRIRLSNFTVDDTLLIGQQPYGIAVDDSGVYAYVPTASDANFGVINPPWLVRVNLSTFQVDDTVLLPFTWGYDVAVDPAATTAYVVQSRSGSEVAKVALGPHMSLDGPSIIVGPGPQAIEVNPKFPFFYTASVNGGGGNTLTKVLIGASVPPPAVTSLSTTSGPTAGGTSVTVSGTGLSSATVTVGGTPASVTSNDDTSIVFTTPTGPEGAAVVSVTTIGGTTSAGTFTYVAPLPQPVAASVPTTVVAVGGSGAATVSWSPPLASGSFAVSAYQVQASPGGASCLTVNLQCMVAGLVDGRPYTFAVRALTGAGWGPWSDPSSAVVPRSPIVITGARMGRRIVITGRVLPGEAVQPWVKLAGQDTFTKSTNPVTAGEDGTFRWLRRTPRGAWVYVTYAEATSNTVDIPAAR